MKILIWGTGSGAEKFLSKLNGSNAENIDVIGFIDNNLNKHGENFYGKSIYSPNEIKSIKFDFLIVASEFLQIYVDIIKMNIDLNKVIPVYINKLMDQIGYRNNFLKNIIGFQGNYIFTQKMAYNKKSFEDQYFKYKDYFRYRTFELVADEIIKNKILGQIAEVGVYKGDFAKILNLKFPNRLLYLFDTFEGFSEVDEKYDIKNGFLNKQFLNECDFKDTSVDAVINKMRYKENIVIKKGYFPKTAYGLEESFAFVSIDVDLYKPIYDALEYFYKRLNIGGYIFIHDYNNKDFFGVKRAIELFEGKYGKLKKVPISDQGGTVIMVK